MFIHRVYLFVLLQLEKGFEVVIQNAWRLYFSYFKNQYVHNRRQQFSQLLDVDRESKRLVELYSRVLPMLERLPFAMLPKRATAEEIERATALHDKLVAWRVQVAKEAAEGKFVFENNSDVLFLDMCHRRCLFAVKFWGKDVPALIEIIMKSI